MERSKEYLISVMGIIIVIFIVLVIIFSANNDRLKHELTSYKDSVVVQEKTIFKLTEDVIRYNIEVENYKNSIVLYNDSINSLINELDSVNEELQINKIKIERIREYNRIAAQGNNIKFLRGWINRVIQ